MEVIRRSDGFRVKFDDEEMDVLHWAEHKFGPNEFLLMLQHWILQRRRDRAQLDGKDLKNAFEQLPEDLQKVIREKINELRFED